MGCRIQFCLNNVDSIAQIHDCIGPTLAVHNFRVNLNVHERKYYVEQTFETPTDGRDFSANNLLHGSDKEATTTGGSQYYKLSYNSEGEPKVIGWYWGAENGGAFQSAAHKAWLALPSGSEAPLRSIALPGFDDNTTDIPLIPYQTEHERGHDDEWYDLYGRKLNGKPANPGLYIHNGEKETIRK